MFLFRRKKASSSDGSEPTVSGILTSSFSFHDMPGGATSLASLAAAAVEAVEDQVEADPSAQDAEDCDRYESVRDVNSGSFGTVQVARDRVTGELVAIKLIPRSYKVSEQVTNEVLVMRRLNHFHTVRLKRVILTQRYLGIVMEYCSAGDMYQFILRTPHGLDEGSAKWFFQQMVIAVEYSHRLGIVHRDIKLRNMVLQEVGGRLLLKLCDFGFSKDFTRQSLPKTRLGTLEYMAPELLQHSSPATVAEGGDPIGWQQEYDGAKIDVWSLGVALFFMLTRSYPYDLQQAAINTEGRQVAIIRAILDGPIFIPDAVSADCRDVLMRMLVKDPGQRISLPELTAHPFFRDGLPKGAEAMNDNPLLYQPPEGLQSEQEIRELCLRASKPVGKCLSRQISGLDELRIIDNFIEDVMGTDYDPLKA